MYITTGNKASAVVMNIIIVDGAALVISVSLRSASNRHARQAASAKLDRER